ncbi:MAG: hypothetical protein KJZ80_20505 [Hyphomicrobiaceae bacterium]|nr:hypothetical protein [Hyphomicrobiaceae bacterium]
MQVNLERKAPPTVTQPWPLAPLGYSAAAYTLAFTLTVVSTVSHEDYRKRMSIGPASLVASPGRTNTVSFEEKRDSGGESWLAKTITEMHANIPEDAWHDVPDTSKFDLDTML